MTRLRQAMPALAAAFAAWACAGPATGPDVATQPLVVRTYAELVDALQPGNAGRRIRVARGEYPVDRALHVPDGATLEGEGIMRIGSDGLPEGFAPGSETTLRVVAGFEGQVLTLGDRSVVRGLRVVDLANPPSQPSLRQGNVVYIGSRAPGDVVAASVIDCEIVTPHKPGFSDAGPLGHGIVLITLNPNLGAAPVAHEAARVSLLVRRSIVRTQTAAALFAINFAARGEVTARLEGNRLEGNMVLSGGVSRPDMVDGAHTQVTSRRNLYVKSGGRLPGWILIGASGSPHFDQAGVTGASRAMLRLDSVDDRIEDFRWAIYAAAARRLGADSSQLSDNRVELSMLDTRIRTSGEGAADLVLQGTLSEVAQFEGPGEFPGGDRNVLRVQMQGVTGSGVRANRYAHVAGPVLSRNMGSGNHLEIVGSPAEFVHANSGIEPAPDAEFFVGDR